jgi:hypothetical protein
MPVTDAGCLCPECLRKEISSRVGLCITCEYSRRLATKSGSAVYLCELSAKNKKFQKYPRLPMPSCDGYTSLPSLQ